MASEIVLLSARQIGDGAGIDSIPAGKVPEILAGLRIHGVYVALRRTAEHQVPGGRQNPRPRRRDDAVLPLDLAGLGNDGAQMAPAFLGAEARSAASAAPKKHLAGAVFRI